MTYNSSFIANDWFHVVACDIEKKESLVWKTFGCAGLGDPRLLLTIGDFAFGDSLFHLQKRSYERDISKLEKLFIERHFNFHIGLAISFDLLRGIIFTHGPSKTAKFLIKIHGEPTQFLGEGLCYIMINFDPNIYNDVAEILKKHKWFCKDIFSGHIFRIYKHTYHHLVDKNHWLECIRVGRKTTDKIVTEYYNLSKEKRKCQSHDIYQFGMQTYPQIFSVFLYAFVIIAIELFYESREEILEIGGFKKAQCRPLYWLINASDLQRFPKFLGFATEFEFQNKDFQTTVKNAAERSRTNPPSYY